MMPPIGSGRVSGSSISRRSLNAITSPLTKYLVGDNPHDFVGLSFKCTFQVMRAAAVRVNLPITMFLLCCINQRKHHPPTHAVIDDESRFPQPPRKERG